MNQYSKAIGSVIGGIAGILVSQGIELQWLTPEWIDAIAIVIGSVLGTYLAPRNQYRD